jgi:hypothetical protein
VSDKTDKTDIPQQPTHPHPHQPRQSHTGQKYSIGDNSPNNNNRYESDIPEMSEMSDSPMFNFHTEEEVSILLVFFVGVWGFAERECNLFLFFIVTGLL